MSSVVLDNLAKVQARVASAAGRVGRNPAEVIVVAISKTVEPERIMAAFQAGHRHFGENRVQEAEDKLTSLAQRHPEAYRQMHWHMVGHLQTNKVKAALGLFEVIQSVDSLRLAEAINRQAVAAGRTVPLLLEVNVTGEASKFGLAVDDVPAVAAEVVHLPALRATGLMTVAPLVADPAEVRSVFRALRELRERLRREVPQSDWQHLSMGMTDDFEVAIEEGATIVRLGRAIFGSRPLA